MALTLEQYAASLAKRADLRWPAPPAITPVRAKPSVRPLSNIRCVLWTLYGTLVNITHGDLQFDDPNETMMDVALTKTIDEFKMWNSMSRKPGQPAEYMREMYKRVFLETKAMATTERHPELPAERIWEGIIKKLLQKDYKFDAGMYGSLNEFSRKVAFFFHTNLQGTGCYPGAYEVTQQLAEQGIMQGFLSDGQCFTPAQLYRGMLMEAPDAEWTAFRPGLQFLSCEVKARKPSATLLESALRGLEKQGIEPFEVLHVGSSITRDIAPAKKLGMTTALFAGDRASLAATADQLKDAATRPDLLITELPQLAQIVS
ncbi:HAD family hydrolase [Tuwongella immobilis]|uniref:HAD family hydrolase n=1 Tax=Tuwongella immobilis TaxID=692036 RepID=A0A6C2YQC4_9BACT|nr:HAD hydrolase-like protein [Tuwongella immobilis]VIP03676.1 Uncharacterized protein OS=Planctomyces maris DSM 8797 GN=PM8797T_07574 PE=4 SV=1: HAD_2 [Tuwongella immobilis]VTS04720.1 Uncharacterized protein OS=Planctomyces maris DSM 8797 GN=PM8797T_07574 PE=4 SV=1: HAD_2 [Tuwongella immobilis]